jgi:FAD/FMN-containing dehydrogenase
LPAPDGDIDMQLKTAKTIIHDILARFEGSISAEHGIGRLKRADFEAELPQLRREMLETLRRAIDPGLMMNPGCQFHMQDVAAK